MRTWLELDFRFMGGQILKLLHISLCCMKEYLRDHSRVDNNQVIFEKKIELN